MEFFTTGERMFVYRKRQNLTSEQLAERCGLSVDEVLQYENDQAVPEVDIATVLAEALGVSVERLLYGL